jgi:hypothetical protein
MKIDAAPNPYNKLDHVSDENKKVDVEKNLMDMFDAVQRPSHYNSGVIEVFDFIRDQKLNFALGNVVKYVARAGKKDPTKLIEDLDKAMWYLRREIEELRKGK